MPTTTPASSPPFFEIVTPSSSTPAALAVVQIIAPDAGSAGALVDALGLSPLPVGAVGVRNLHAIDEAVVARPDERTIVLTPHASPLVLRDLARWLAGHGVLPVRPDPTPDPARVRARYPEAADVVEACMLDTLSIAASPLAIDLLLAQPARWRHPNLPIDPERDETLSRLVIPPLVAGVGHANVGKSTLVNALASRTVSITADAPGTTRDHVGVTLDLAGLVVRWFDTPGFPDGEPTDPVEAAAMSLSLAMIEAADLVVSCADGATPFLDRSALPIDGATPVLTCATRADLHPPPAADVRTAAVRSEGLDRLAAAVRDVLVPPEALAAESPWRFHPALPR